MRSFRFTAKNIGRERYLTYIMGEGMDFDEDVLDYCEENDIPEIVNIIYEEDDDFDYLTYDISGRMTVENYIQGVLDKEKVFMLLRNVATSMINIKEYALPMSYVILNKSLFISILTVLKLSSCIFLWKVMLRFRLNLRALSDSL